MLLVCVWIGELCIRVFTTTGCQSSECGNICSFLPFQIDVTQVVPEKGPLNVCACVFLHLNYYYTRLRASFSREPG